ncbi:EAL domain-containing protein [Sulfurimonas crateris]|uniref:EAL domain-containing protein n=1 Tax=Sulfurimonas crateris TaxID=2574727 RepID=A0A4U2Z5A4_9BACT|nr:EAL domain-containing protein [Sulfurimonas crateris]TKI69358.1 EAL domain-containing protein [Sulfurimonas crateris]
MSCQKCQNIQPLTNKSGNLLISCAVAELADIMVEYLTKRNIVYELEDKRTIWANIDTLADTISDMCTTHFTSKVLRDDVKMLFLESFETLTASVLIRMKTLQQYKDLLGSQKLIEIIEDGLLTTHFQPIIDIKTNTIYGYESLVRGVKDDGSLIYPDKLFGWAKDGDMLFYLDRACRETSLKTAAVKNIHAKVFINFIPTAIYDPSHCLQSTVEWAKQLDFDPKNIIFEVVESEHVADLEHLKSILDFYKSQGYMVALDDVGSGYASLNMLAKLRPDIVKIDREIIDSIDTNKMNQSIFKAIVQIAKENDIIVLAEGIERAEELAFCAKEGADLAQGYYFGKPSAEPRRKL